MPQMSPLNWLMIFMVMILIILLMNSVNYFIYLKQPYNKKKLSKFNLNWKW